MIDLGDPLPIQTIEVRDSTGALANAGAMVLTVTLPDGTTANPGFTNPSTGRYVPGTYIPAVGGKFTIRWAGTGLNSAAYTQEFWVSPIPGVTAWPFASPDELRTWVDATATDIADEKAWLILNAVSGDIRREAGWSITQETGAVFTRDAPYGPDVFLPTLHLTAVTSVTVDGTTLTSVDYEWNEVGRLTRLAGVYWRRSIRQLANVVVVANHGWPVGQVPDAVKSLCLDFAARRLGYPDGIPKAYRVDTYQETPLAALGPLRLEDDPRVPRVPVVA